MSKLRKFKRPVGKTEGAAPKRRRLTKQAWWSIGLGAIMIFSIAGAFVADSGGGDSLKYGETSFRYVNGEYAAKIGKAEHIFSYFPTEVEDIALPPEAKMALLSTPQVILTFKPVPGQSFAIDSARFDISNALYGSGKSVVEGIAGLDSRYAIPYITCENATAFVPAIFIEVSEGEMGISFTDNCIILRGQGEDDILKLKDRLLYSIYGVMN